MPTKKGSKVSLTEDEAKQLAQSMGINTPSMNQSQNPQVDAQSQQQPQQQMQPQMEQDSGWWGEPIRHSLAQFGIKTVMDGYKPSELHGSVYQPSENFYGRLKTLMNSFEDDEIKKTIARVFSDVEEFEDLEDELHYVIDARLGDIFHMRRSMEERNQTVNGRFEISIEQHQRLEETKKNLDRDVDSMGNLVNDLKTEYESSIADARSEFQDYSERLRHKIKDDEKYRLKVQNKLSELVVSLNQQRADYKYAKYVKDSMVGVQTSVDDLYQNAIKR